MHVFGILVVSLLFASTAAAIESAPFKVNDVVAQQQQIRSDVIAGKGRYASMPERKRNDLLSRQEHLMHTLEGKQTSAELTEDEYMEAFSALEWIEAAINNQEDERLICRREKTIGSNRTTRICRTAAQMEIERELARDQIDQADIQNRR